MSGEEYWTDFRGNSWIRRDAFDDLCTKYLELRSQDDSGMRKYAYALEDECDELSAKNDLLATENADLREMNADRIQCIFEQKAELDNLRANYKALSTQNEGLKTELDRANQSATYWFKQHKALDKQYEVLEDLREDARVELDQLQTKHRQLNSEHEGLRVSYEEVVQAKEYHRVDAKTWEETAHSRLQEIKQLQSELRDARCHRDMLSTERDELRAKYDFLHKEFNRLYKERNDLRDERDRLKAKLEAEAIKRGDNTQWYVLEPGGLTYFELSAKYEALCTAVDKTLSADGYYLPSMTREGKLRDMALRAKHYEANMESMSAKYEELVAYMKRVGCDDAAKLSAFNRVVELCTPYVEER